MNTLSFSQTATPMASASPAESYRKSRELLELVYSHGFQLAKTAYAYDAFIADLHAEFPSACQASGRVAGTEVHAFWMQDGQIVGVWDQQMSVGVTGYSNTVRAH